MRRHHGVQACCLPSLHAPNPIRFSRSANDNADVVAERYFDTMRTGMRVNRPGNRRSAVEQTKATYLIEALFAICIVLEQL